MVKLDPAKQSQHLVESLYALLLDEVRDGRYDDEELTLIRDPILYYGRYLDSETRIYALNNAKNNLSAALDYLGPGKGTRRLLDLGCGLGMQSILFAVNGWEVLGLDMYPNSVALSWKRKAFFESQLGRELKLEFVALDFRKADPNSLGGKFDAVFSMAAFAQIQPLAETVAKVSTLLKDRGSVFIWEENPGSIYSSLLRLRQRPVPWPRDIQDEFARHGFTTDLLSGGCAIPRQLWRSPALTGAVSLLDNMLKKSLPLSFSYVLGASRGNRVRSA